MSLFEVKGWNVPSQAAVADSSPHPSKKRKRSLNNESSGQSVKVNVEKLLRKMDKSTSRTQSKKIKRSNKRLTENLPSPGTSPKQSSNPKEEQEGDVVPQENFTPRKQATSLMKPPSDLTFLQASMKNSLDGARFRWINELLYTIDSAEAHKLMRDDPKLYEEYHTGFRQQVCSWPSNPVSHYISALSTYPGGTVIADLGCGEAALARGLVPQGYSVLSFDLVSDGAYVIEADVCQKIPLPGSEESVDENQCQIVDVCVCALSLMGLNWMQCIRESWRVLKLGGELHIAEVTSRFTNLDHFEAIIGDLGFKLKSRDSSNTHFTLFEFRKVARAPFGWQKWEELRAKNGVLKPCKYKRR